MSSVTKLVISNSLRSIGSGELVLTGIPSCEVPSLNVTKYAEREFLEPLGPVGPVIPGRPLGPLGPVGPTQ